MTRLLIGLGLLATVVMLTGCRGLFDDTYVLWSRYNYGPGGNFWKVESEHSQVVWKSSSGLNNREFCELAIAERRKIDVKLIEDMKKVGVTVATTDYVCLPKGMHP